MRLLRLDFGDDLHRLDLHPLVTVVDDLSPDQQLQLFAAVRDLARGTARSFRGLVEHGGDLTEVRPPSDLTIDEQRRCPYDVVLHLDDHLEEGDTDGLEAEIDRCQRQAEIDAVRLEELRADLKPSLWADVVLLRSRIESQAPAPSSTPSATRSSISPAMTSASGPAGEPDPPPPMGDDAGRDAERDRLEAVVAAIAGIESRPRYVERFSPEVEDLLSRWSRFVEVREQHGEHLSMLEQQLDEAREQVRRAEAELVEAEDAAKPVMLSDAEEARLEELAERAEFTGGGWRRRSGGLSSEEQQELDELLAKVGVRSWTEYSMFRLAPDVAPDLQEAIDGARRKLAEADSGLQQAEVAVESDPVAMELETEYERLRSEATTHMGAMVPNDVGAGLRELVERRDNPEWVDAVHQLDRLLHHQRVTDTLLAEEDPDQLLDWARIWVDYERARLAEDPGPAPEVGRGSTGAHAVPVYSGPPAADAAPEDIEDMRRALDEAERKLVRHRRALDRIRVVQARAAASSERLAHLQRLAERAPGPCAATADEVIASVSPVVHQIRSDLGYAVPIVMSGSLPLLASSEIARLMDHVEDLATRVQVIVVSARPEAIDWAAASGPSRALHSTGAARSLWSTLP